MLFSFCSRTRCKVVRFDNQLIYCGILFYAIFTVGNEVAKVMFLQASVCPRGGGVSASVHAGIPRPPGSRHTPYWNAFLSDYLLIIKGHSEVCGPYYHKRIAYCFGVFFLTKENDQNICEIKLIILHSGILHQKFATNTWEIIDDTRCHDSFLRHGNFCPLCSGVL